MSHGDESHPTLEEQVYRRLLDAIVSGRYGPGTKLVGSRLAPELGVSRITVANALKRLGSEGFVVSQAHREAVVASLDEHTLHEVFLIRHALEDVLLRELASHMTPGAVAALREIDASVRDAIRGNDAVSYRRQERAFHLAVYGASGLRMVTTLLMDLWNRLEPYRGRRYSKVALIPQSLDDRTAIIDALEAGDGEMAAREMRRHVDRGYQQFLDVLRDGVDPSVAARRSRSGRQRSVPLLPAPEGSLRRYLDDLEDARRAQGRVFRQGAVLAMTVLAWLCGARSVHAIARWGEACHPAIRESLGLPASGTPSGPTIHRVLRRFADGQLDGVVRQWLGDHGFRLDDGDGDGEGDVFGLVATRIRSGDDGWAAVPALLLSGTAEESLAATELDRAIRETAGML